MTTTATHALIDVDDAVAVAVALAASAGRHVIGIAGSPGAGKSTLARRIVAAVTAAHGPGVAVQVPMDGFHLSNAALDALGRRDRKGAIDTFDAGGYVALLRRLADPAAVAGAGAVPDHGAVAGDAAVEGVDDVDNVVWAPDFDRGVDEPVAGSIAVPASARLVVTEGNYLLDPSLPWSLVPSLLTETWFCAAAESVRVDRLVGRHMRHGRDHDAARAWATEVDAANARRVEATAARATRIVRT